MHTSDVAHRLFGVTSATKLPRQRRGALGAGVLILASACVGVAEPAMFPEVLKTAPSNTWVKVLEMKTGGREQPIFVYAAQAKKFVLATGIPHEFGQGADAVKPRHYDTEELDLSLSKWINAYPPGLEQGRPESGPLGESYSKQRSEQSYLGGGIQPFYRGTDRGSPFYKDGDAVRLGAGGQWLDAKTYGEYCYAPVGGKGGTVFAYMWDRTIAYDVAARTWKDMEAKPREKCRIWGSLCYDSVNNELLHAGGDGGTADISTWVYSIEKNEWRKLECGSAKIKELLARSRDLCWQAKTLVGRCASRHGLAETAAEAKVDLPGEAAKLAAAIKGFADEVAAAGLSGSEKTAAEVAVKRLNAAIAAARTTGPTLVSPITPVKLTAVRAVRELIEQVEDALSPEPPGRAHSQIALDTVSNKIVLFGGDGLDRVLSDTWIYDCKTRTWEQRFPAKSPVPRAGHIMAWLPNARKIVMSGGYSKVPLPQEVWTYDVGANEWNALLTMPLAGRTSPNSPYLLDRDYKEYQMGAVADGDVLICYQVLPYHAQAVWACKVDPTKPAAGSEAVLTVAPGSYVYNVLDPAIWEKVAQPDPAATRKTLAELPVNQFTTLKFPKYAPGANNRWGTTTYDTDRHQFLFWGGGHGTSRDDDVSHFSVLGGFWSIGYLTDEPIERVYATQPTPLSFRDRVHVPVHAYRAYAYDPTAGKMFYFDRAYDPLVREWIPTPYPGLEHLGPMQSQLKATPTGVVCLSTKGLYRFDAKAGKFSKLPWTGPLPGDVWCDGTCLTYDSKRNCLWIAQKDAMYKYDFVTGASEKIAPAKSNRPTGVDWLINIESVYLPDADLILAMKLVKRADGRLVNYAWDPKENKFYWVELKYVDNGKDVDFKDNPFSWQEATAYDPGLKIVLLNNCSAFKVWALKFDRASAKLTEVVN